VVDRAWWATACELSARSQAGTHLWPFNRKIFDCYCDFHSSWDKKAEWQYRKGGLAFAKALIGKRKRVWGVGESTYWGAKTRCELRKRFLEKQQNAQTQNAKRKTRKNKK
jgi:hypothetical protein